MRELVEQLCQPGAITTVVQPVVRPGDQVIVGYEALSRMSIAPNHPPDWWLNQAEELGLRRKLEIACLAAIARLGPVPEGRLLFINISPSTIANPAAALALVGSLPGRVVIELTEQEAVIDYTELRTHLTRWLSQGLRIAIDDAGAGYSSLRHVIEVSPDFELDPRADRGIDQDRTRLALVRSVLAFAREVGTSVIAEGIEAPTELEVLRDVGVNLVQGYLLARPGPPWPSIATAVPLLEPMANPPLDRLHESLLQAKDSRSACSAVAEYLFRQGEIMPSVYLERHGELRCMAQRGLWQVLDGMPGSAGITGQTWKLGRPVVVPDVRADPHYLEAIPGVVARFVCQSALAPSRSGR